MLKEIIEVLELSGQGESVEKAFNQVFSQVRNTVARKYPNQAIIQIDPQDVTVISSTELQTTEKFFGLLFPREISSFELVIALTVKIKMIDLTQIHPDKKKNNQGIIKKILNENRIEG